MNIYELKPTVENLFDTYKDDSIGRNKHLIKFIELLDSLEVGCTIAVDGQWGSGKTFFVKQAKMILDAYNAFRLENGCDNNNADEIKRLFARYQGSGQETGLRNQVTVYYDAWLNDSDADPLLSLIYSIAREAASDYSFSDSAKLSEVMVNAASVAVEFFTGTNVLNLIESIKNGENPLEAIQKEHELEEKIKEFFESLLPEKGERLVVFIDELDRCKPRFAIRLLERIKHYFDNENITFVLSINGYELQKSIKRYYGESFDACRYLDRFFDLSISMPEVDKAKIYQLIGFSNSNKYAYDYVARKIITKYSFSIRETIRYLKMLRIAANKLAYKQYSAPFPEQRGIQVCVAYMLPVIIGLKMHDSKLHMDFMSGSDASPLIDMVDEEFKYNAFRSLLDSGESFLDEPNKTKVDMISKVHQVYNAVFVESLDDCYEKEIGLCSFSKGTKEMLIEIASLLSRYSDYTAL